MATVRINNQLWILHYFNDHIILLCNSTRCNASNGLRLWAFVPSLLCDFFCVLLFSLQCVYVCASMVIYVYILVRSFTIKSMVKFAICHAILLFFKIYTKFYLSNSKDAVFVWYRLRVRVHMRLFVCFISHVEWRNVLHTIQMCIQQRQTNKQT